MKEEERYVNKAGLKAAAFISLLGHPLLLSSLISAVAFFRLFSFSKALLLTGFVLLVSIPLAAWNYVKTRSGAYSNFDVSVRSQRFSMYVVLSSLLGLVSLLAWLSGQPLAFCIGISLCLAMVLVSFLLNTILKTSLHAAMSFFMAFGLLQLHLGGGVAMLFMAVLVSLSRLVLKRHSLPEVISGSFTGTVAGLGLVYLLPPG